ncbi:MAG: permease prefix domain 2-containing transporter, partial [Tunicatimonas sp.]|uniref:permease prefix domain 2-containing transporter n=1 Tax=Tunicatimonas sp. TaxID=1940096 RepID=UPI003C7582E3
MDKPQRSYQPPPRWVDKLLERFCAPELLEEVLGDLHERYYMRVQREGEVKARRGYWREVLAYLRPSTFKRSTFGNSA